MTNSVNGLDTGFTDLNYYTSGLQDGDLIVIASRPYMGKTALCLNMGQNAALRSGKSVAVFSLEMSKEQLTQRMICSEARVDAHRLRTGYLGQDDWDRIADAVNRLWDANLFIDDSKDLSVPKILATCQRLRDEQGLDLVVVDYLQLIHGDAQDDKNRNQENAEIVRGLKSLAREMKVPVVVLSQLSPAMDLREDKRPMFSDLHGVDSIEWHADVVVFVYRPAYYERKSAISAEPEERTDDSSFERSSELEGEEAEIIIAKQRNGPTGIFKLSFLPKYARFENLAEYREESPF